MEGIPELRNLHAATRIGSNQQGRDSPIEGLVHQRMTSGGIGLEDMAVQTGASLDGCGAAGPSAGEAPAPPDYDDDDNDFGGFDDGGFGGWGEDYDDGAAAMPPPPAVLPNPRKPRRIVLNPGSRLRAQLPRKSLAVDPEVGRREVAPGIRRSMRRAQEPLRWWLGEKKEFDRIAHKTMPTIRTVTHTDPNTPWRMVTDPREWKKSKKVRGSGRRKRTAAVVDDQGEGVDHQPVPSDAEASSDEETEVLNDGLAGRDQGEEVQGVGLFGSEPSPIVIVSSEEKTVSRRASQSPPSPAPATISIAGAVPSAEVIDLGMASPEGEPSRVATMETDRVEEIEIRVDEELALTTRTRQRRRSPGKSTS